MDYLSGVILASLFLGISVFTPQYTLSLSRHIPVTATLLSVVYALLMMVIRRRWSSQLAPRMNGPLGVLLTLFIWMPFILSWYLFSRMGYPVWPAALVGLGIPAALTLHAFQHASTAPSSIDVLYRVLTLNRILFYGLILLSSLFFGYGIPLLSLFIYTQVTQQPIGPLVLTQLNLLLLGGAGLSGAIYAVILRSRTDTIWQG
jgi:hypothetical protein